MVNLRGVTDHLGVLIGDLARWRCALRQSVLNRRDGRAHRNGFTDGKDAARCRPP